MQQQHQLSWRLLLSAVVLVPLAVGVIPLSGTPWTLNAFVQAKVIALGLTLGLALVAWAFSRTPAAGLHLGRPLLPLGVFLLVASASAAFGIDPRMAVFGDFEQGSGLLVLLMCGLGLFLTTQLARTDAAVEELTSFTIAVAAGIALIGLLQQLLLVDVLGYLGQGAPEWMARRGYGTIGNPDTYGAYLVLPALLALHRLRTAVTSRERLRWGAALAVIASSCLLSQTRGALFGLVVGVAAYAFGTRKRGEKRTPSGTRRLDLRSPGVLAAALIAVAVVIGLAGGAIAGVQTDFWNRYFSPESIASLGGRIPLWRSALEITAQHPLLGVGPDSFRLAWYPTRTVEHLASGVGLIITDPHSVPLHLAATTGLLGLAAFVALVGMALAGGLKQRREKHAPDYTGWLYAAIGIAAAMLTSMSATILIFSLFVALAVLIAPRLRGQMAPAASIRTALRVAGAAVGAALAVFAVVTAVAQVTAVGAGVEDTILSAERATRAASIAPWDTKLRDLKNERLVQAALEAAFGSRTDAGTLVENAAATLDMARQAEPQEYLHPYRSAVLLIGVGQVLGGDYTARGIDAGLAALAIYPDSLELRTGLASGYLQLGDAARAEELLDGLWDADPDYASAGTTYAMALMAQGRTAEARSVLATLAERFPDDASVRELSASIEGAE